MLDKSLPDAGRGHNKERPQREAHEPRNVDTFPAPHGHPQGQAQGHAAALVHGACHETQQAAGHRLPGPPPLAAQHEHARHEAQGCGPHIVELAVVEQYRVGPGQGSEHQAIYHDARPRVAHPGAAGGGPVQGCHHEGEQRRGRHARQQAREPRHEYVGHAPVGAQPVHRCIVGIGQQRAFARQGREPSLAEDDVVAHEVPAVECHCRSRRNGAQQHPRHVFRQRFQGVKL